MVSVLRRLFCRAKADLGRLASFHEQEEHLIKVIGQWEAEEIAYVDVSSSDHYITAVSNRRDAQKQLNDNFIGQSQVKTALNVCRKDIEQICYEFEQIYDGELDYDNGPIREYYILFDDLRFDPNITDVKHDFINDLYTFTCLHFGYIEKTHCPAFFYSQ